MNSSELFECPQCGNIDICSTTMGSLDGRDRNKVSCKCGWNGIAQDWIDLSHARKQIRELQKTEKHSKEQAHTLQSTPFCLCHSCGVELGDSGCMRPSPNWD